MGRFLQTDPIGYEDQYNLYAYVYNDPINNKDPSGKCPHCAIGGVVGGVSGLLIEGGSQILEGEFSPTDLGAATLGGAAGGATLAATGNPYVAGAVSSATESVTKQLVNNGSVDLDTTAIDTAGGTLGGKLGDSATKLVKGSGRTIAERTGNLVADSKGNIFTPKPQTIKDTAVRGTATIAGAAAGTAGANATTEAVNEIVVTGKKRGWFRRFIDKINPF